MIRYEHRTRQDFDQEAARHQELTSFWVDAIGWRSPAVYRNPAVQFGDNMTVAYDGDEIIGVFRYTYEKCCLESYSTWVAAKARGRGVASELWRLALHRTRARTVRVTTISTEGSRLVRALMRQHRVHWHVKFGE